MAGQNSAAAASSASGFVSVAKDAVSTLRDVTLLLLALLLIAFPSTFNTVLEKAGFEEGSFAGLKWKSGLLKSDAALKEALATIAELQKTNDGLVKTLAQARGDVKDPSLQKEIVTLQQNSTQVNSNAQQVQSAVSDTIASNAALVNRILSGSDGKWGVVWSGDAKLDGAQYEVSQVARKLGLPNPSIYLRQGSYRSVAVVDDKSQADALLSKARQRRSDAYIVNMKTWCPNPVEKTGYAECARP